MLGPLVIWAVHFVAVYAVASLADLGGATEAALWRIVGLVLSVGCLAAVGVAAIPAVRAGDASPLARRLGLGGSLVSLLAIAWQSLPLLIAR